MLNIHERRIDAPAAQVGALLAGAGGPDDRLWPTALWMPMELDQPLRVGSRGGHADIRYVVTAYEPGRRLEMTFERPTLLRGQHVLEVRALADGSALLRHVLDARPVGAFRVLLPLAVRWIHDAVVEDLLDRAEQAVGSGPAQPARWSPWVRVLRRTAGLPPRRPAVRPVPVPPHLLAAAGLADVDFSDAFAARLPAGASRDVADWHAALVTAGAPPWVDRLMTVRSVLARALRLDTAEVGSGQVGSGAVGSVERGFPVLHRSDELVVSGADDHHLDFRAVLAVREADDGAELVAVTVVRRHNLLGRAYFALVGPFHRRIVPALLRRALARPPAARPTSGLDRQSA